MAMTTMTRFGNPRPPFITAFVASKEEVVFPPLRLSQAFWATFSNVPVIGMAANARPFFHLFFIYFRNIDHRITPSEDL
jgi:hypothetical protein